MRLYQLMPILAVCLIAVVYVARPQSGAVPEQRITEASGLARASEPHAYWTHNDKGNDPIIFLVDPAGTVLRTVTVGAPNTDWEDITSYQSGNKRMLIIGDIGDNKSKRSHLTLWAFEEPEPERLHVNPISITVDIPDGPRDFEGLAFDPVTKNLLLLSKRDAYPRLYVIPLHAARSDGQLQPQHVTAKFVGELRHLPAPTAREKAIADEKGVRPALPTSLDINESGTSMVVTTYQEAYLYQRKPTESWAAAIQNKPMMIDIPQLVQTEGGAFAYGDKEFVTISEKLPLVIRVTALK